MIDTRRGEKQKQKAESRMNAERKKRQQVLLRYYVLACRSLLLALLAVPIAVPIAVRVMFK